MWNFDARKPREIKRNFFLKNMTSFLTAGFVHLCPVSQFRLETWPKTGEKEGVRGAPPALRLWPAGGVAGWFRRSVPLPCPHCACALSYFSSSGDEGALVRASLRPCLRSVEGATGSLWRLLEERDCPGSELAQGAARVCSVARAQCW